MRSLSVQYFLTFAVMGSLLPYVSVFFRDRGLEQSEIGLAFALASAAVLLAPVLVTALADLRVDARRLMSLAMLLTALALLGLSLVHSLAAVMVLWAVHSLTWTPLLPLQDGLLFGIQDRQRRAGRTPIAYHKVRVWGTVGFIAPALVLYLLLRQGTAIEMPLLCAAACALVAGAWAFVLPDPRQSAHLPPSVPDTTRLPTASALRALREPHVLVFCIAMFLMQIVTAAYYAFYPIYLTETIGIDYQWVGLISAIGVGIEIFFMLGFGRLRAAMGFKWLVVLGFAATAVRLLLLGMVTTPLIAVGTQVFHGLMVLVLHVAPPVFLNERAEDDFRHSMQGLYTMLIFGGGRIIGNALSGWVAQWSITGLFICAALLCAVAGALVAFAFRPARPATTPMSQ